MVRTISKIRLIKFTYTLIFFPSKQKQKIKKMKYEHLKIQIRNEN